MPADNAAAWVCVTFMRARRAAGEGLPQHGQEIWRAAYNNAWDEYKDPAKRRGDDSREQVAAQVAWAAVKHRYEKDDRRASGAPSTDVVQ